MNCKKLKTLYRSLIKTTIGDITAVADEEFLYLLSFSDSKFLIAEINNLKKNMTAEIADGTTNPILLINNELNDYFDGKITSFKTPLYFIGTQFQKKVWTALCNVSYGKTSTYKKQAIELNAPKSYRAIANANGKNQFIIAVPCHRIIRSNSELGGYKCGIERKKWLLEHESKAIHL